jgi:hypothetical protein
LRFEIAHEFDASLGVVEQAVLSPALGQRLSERLTAIETVETVQHELCDGELHRVLRFQAKAPLALLSAYPVARDAMRWDEDSRYRLADHASSWSVRIDPRFERYFGSAGTYRLESVGPNRTRRTVIGELEIRLKMMGRLVERAALTEIKKTYDAEASALRSLANV